MMTTNQIKKQMAHEAHDGPTPSVFQHEMLNAFPYTGMLHVACCMLHVAYRMLHV